VADRELEALPTHQLDQHRERQLTPTLNLPDLGPLALEHAERHVSHLLVIESDGSSTVMTGSGRGSSAAASVSPIMISGMPATQMISPADASSASTRSSASVTYSSLTLTRSTCP